LGKDKVSKRSGWQKKNDRQAVVMIVLQTLGLFVFSIYPILYVLRFSFFDYNMMTSKFVGIRNFVRVFTNDSQYWKSILNTFIIGGTKLAIELPLSFILAYIIDSKYIKAKSFFRLTYYMPSVISASIVGLVFYFLFSAGNGVVNGLLGKINIISDPIPWFSGKWTAMSVIIIASIWQGFGVNTLFFSSAMASIPKDYYESADLDGASTLKKLIYITIPSIGPMVQVICMLAILNTLKMMDMVKVLTNGNPAGETEVLMLYLYKKFFSPTEMGGQLEIGYGCALGVVTAIVLGIITLVYQYMSRKLNQDN